MPGPYCTADEVLAEVRGRLNLAADTTPPEHFQGLVETARRRAYLKMVGLLGRRGYSVAAIDGWDGRADYNKALAVIHIFLASRYAQESMGEALREELRGIEKELGDDEGLVLADSLGATVAPDLILGGAVFEQHKHVLDDLETVKPW